MGERMRPDYETQAGDTYFVKRVGWRYEVWVTCEETKLGEWRALHGLRFWSELSAHRVAQSLQIASNQAWWWRNRLEDAETEADAIAEASVGSVRHDVEPVEGDGIVMVACGQCQGIGCDFCDGFGHFNRPVRGDNAEAKGQGWVAVGSDGMLRGTRMQRISEIWRDQGLTVHELPIPATTLDPSPRPIMTEAPHDDL